MKKLLLVALLTCSSVQAETYCEGIESLSRTIMSARQADVALIDAMKAISDSKVTKMLVLEAYKKNLWSTDRYKEKAINEFANTWYMACLSNEEESTNE